MLAEFDMVIPKSLPEALSILAENRAGLVALAGGTNLVVDMRGGRHMPKIVISIDRLPELSGIREEDGFISIGANTTIAELLHNPLMTTHAPVLLQAARLFANPLIRNRATVGGNLVDGSPAADTAPPLLALDAEVELVSLAGHRCLPLQDFFVHVRKTLLKPDELLERVRIPKAPVRRGYAYHKIGLRKADAIAVVGAAITVDLDADDRCIQARIGLGSVAPRPIRAEAAEAAMKGQKLTLEATSQAAHLAAEAVSPISDIRGSAEYRSQMVVVLVRRLFQQIADQYATEQE